MKTPNICSFAAQTAARRKLPVLRGEAGEVVEYADEEADLSQTHEYSVIPRHALLYASGELLTGAESLRARYTPGGILGIVEEFLTPSESAQPPAEAETLQSLFG